MGRNNPAAESWGAFMRSHLARLKMSQADFGRRMEAADYGISKQTVSQWVNGENAPDANTALAVAQVLGAQDTEALRAAGFGPVADRLDGRGVGAAGPEPLDPVVQEIMGMTNLSLKYRQTMVADYLAGQEEIRRRYRSVSKMASDEIGSAGSAA